MPDMNGDELVQAIKALKDLKSRDIPIVAMTANVAAGMREVFLEKGYNDFISKPLDTYQLNELLERWIGADKRQNIESQNYVALGIKGLDENKGMANCFHSQETYRELLDLYCIDLEYRLDYLRFLTGTKEKMTKEQETGLLSNLHILKSACETIGAMAFAKTAVEMEISTRQNKRDTKQLSLFVEELGIFRETILHSLQSA